MNFALSFIIICFSSLVTAQELTHLVDYHELDHDISLDNMRAGNHDPSGVNEYYFSVKAYALAVLKEERKKDFSSRLKVEKDFGSFGQLKLSSLSFWEKQVPAPSLKVSGESLRQLVSNAMRTMKVTENQVAVLCQVQLYEKDKQFFILGEDRLVGSTFYYIIPENLPRKPKIENTQIKILDELGTSVKLAISFDSLDPKKKKKRK